ncbi:hypothetical protein D9M68_407770 [compost metagenome]
MAGAMRSWSTPISCSTGRALSSTSAPARPTARASHRAWRTSGPISSCRLPPKRSATLAVVASRVPVISRNTGIQMELPRATAARSRGLTRPAITASTNPMAVLESWATMIGAASLSSARSSALARLKRDWAWDTESSISISHPPGVPVVSMKRVADRNSGVAWSRRARDGALSQPLQERLPAERDVEAEGWLVYALTQWSEKRAAAP